MKKIIKFNIIDLLIFTALVFAVLITVFCMSDNFEEMIFTDDRKDKADITVKTGLLSDEYSDKLSLGQNVIDYDTGDVLGIISNIVLNYPETMDTNESHNFYAVIEIASEAEFNGDYFLLNNKKLLANKITRFSVPELYFEGNIISVVADGYKR